MKIQDIFGKLWSVASEVHTHIIDDIAGLREALNSKAALDHLHEAESNTVFVRINGSQVPINTAVGNMRTDIAGKADVNHTQAISTITGLQAALDGKLDSFISYDATKRAYEVSEMPAGHLILINQSDALVKGKLSELIVQTELSLDQIHFHLNSGDLKNDFFLVRRFTWTGGTPILNHHFIEVVGAWD